MGVKGTYSMASGEEKIEMERKAIEKLQRQSANLNSTRLTSHRVNEPLVRVSKWNENKDTLKTSTNVSLLVKKMEENSDENKPTVSGVGRHLVRNDSFAVRTSPPRLAVRFNANDVVMTSSPISKRSCLNAQFESPKCDNVLDLQPEKDENLQRCTLDVCRTCGSSCFLNNTPPADIAVNTSGNCHEAIASSEKSENEGQEITSLETIALEDTSSNEVSFNHAAIGSDLNRSILTHQVLKGYFHLMKVFTEDRRKRGILASAKTTAAQSVGSSELQDWNEKIENIHDYLCESGNDVPAKTFVCQWILSRNFGNIEFSLDSIPMELEHKFGDFYHIFIKWGKCSDNQCQTLLVVDGTYRKYKTAVIEITESNIDNLMEKFVLCIEKISCPKKLVHSEININDIEEKQFRIYISMDNAEYPVNIKWRYNYRSKSPNAMDAYDMFSRNTHIELQNMLQQNS